MTTTAKVFTGALHREQRGHGKRFVPEPPTGPVRRPARVAVMLASPSCSRSRTRSGTRSLAAMCATRRTSLRRLGFTRARLTYLLDLTLLAPDLQEQVLFLDAAGGVEPMSERALRVVAHAGSWKEQRGMLRSLALAGAPTR